MIESGEAHEDDHPIKVSAAVDSIQWVKKNEDSLEPFYQTINSNKLLDRH